MSLTPEILADRFATNPAWANEVARLIDEIPGGGADYGEVLRACAAIRAGDDESWISSWCSIGESVERLGLLAERRGEEVTAAESYFRASNYYRMAGSILAREDPRDSRMYELHRGLFRQAASIATAPKIESITIPTRGEANVEGYLVRPPPVANAGDRPPPLCVVLGDVDSTSEEMFFSYGLEAAKRGFAVLLLDPPGQGHSRRARGMAARFDSEYLVTSAIEYASSFSPAGRDPVPGGTARGIALIGSGIGAYYAARAAAKEKRVGAVAIFGAVYNAVADLYDFYPPIRRWMMWSIGAVDPSEARAKFVEFNLEGVASLIDCPILINQGSFDVISSPVAASRLHDAVRHKNKILKTYKAGHGISTFRAEAVSYTLDWLKRKLDRSAEPGETPDA